MLTLVTFFESLKLNYDSFVLHEIISLKNKSNMLMLKKRQNMIKKIVLPIKSLISENTNVSNLSS